MSTSETSDLNKSVKMEKHSSTMKTLVALALLLCSLVARGGADEGPAAVERWFRHMPYMSSKLTKLKFYYHENRVAAVPTAVEVARANMTAASPTLFGSTMVFDDPLTVGPDPSSRVIGYAQGMYTSASQSENAFLLVMNLVFIDGPYAGSTLSAIGRDTIEKEFREMSILGGTGVFRLGRGSISTHTVALDPATYNAVVEYNAFVQHYGSPSTSSY